MILCIYIYNIVIYDSMIINVICPLGQIMISKRGHSAIGFLSAPKLWCKRCIITSPWNQLSAIMWVKHGKTIINHPFGNVFFSIYLWLFGGLHPIYHLVI